MLRKDAGYNRFSSEEYSFSNIYFPSFFKTG